MRSLLQFAKLVGLHPLVAFGLFAIDWMLFGVESATGGVGCLVSVPVGLALALPSILLQRSLFRDSWAAAIGKGLMVGLLTAIPTALPSIVTLGGGGFGLVYLLGEKDGPDARQLPPST